MNLRKALSGALMLWASSTMAQTAPDLSGLINILDTTPEGSWVKVNQNIISEAWTPSAQRPLMDGSNPDPHAIIGAWSSYAWDQNRGDLWIFGGGHANYSGNDVYRWRGTTRRWERASLPSEIKQDDLRNWMAVDGPMNAPTAAHTYDNNIFLPISDRFLTFGGAAYNNGSIWMMQTGPTTQRRTGPYMFDPNKANANKVGGTTGSHVKRSNPFPDVVGGNMWQNRDIYGRSSPSPLPQYYVNGCTAYAQENGKDVVYVGANTFGGTELNVHKYTVNDVNNPALDTMEMVGAYRNGAQDQTVCGYDSVSKIFLRTSNNTFPFAYWNLQTPGPTNLNERFMPTDPTGEFPTLLSSGAVNMLMCSVDFDETRRKFALWCGNKEVWMVTAPASLSPTGWTIVKQPTPQGVVPTNTTSTGNLGKWKYVSNLDVFLALQKSTEGNIWLYKPVGWQRPGGGTANVPPSVSLNTPTNAAAFNVGDTIPVSANANDQDGNVTLVEFFDGTTKIGDATTGSPYQFNWTTATAGTHTITAVATDNTGAKTTSSAVTVSVTGGGGTGGGTVTVVLQDGLNAYNLTRDTYLRIYFPTGTGGGVSTTFLEQDLSYTTIVKFGIFQSEGGPVPDNATINSATFSIYKASVYDTTYGLHRMLQSWAEGTSSWTLRAPGSAWGTAGALMADVDYASIATAQGTVGWSPGWLSFDVTSSVSSMRNGAVPNYGWRLKHISGNRSSLKTFNAREFATTTLRPKLEITYTTN